MKSCYVSTFLKFTFISVDLKCVMELELESCYRYLTSIAIILVWYFPGWGKTGPKKYTGRFSMDKHYDLRSEFISFDSIYWRGS